MDFALSISDDDLCATCKYLIYNPGDFSLCRLVSRTGDWPGFFDEDGYCVACDEFKEQ
jgi:hypothetical protein